MFSAAKKQQRNSKQSITKFYDDLILQNTSSNKHGIIVDHHLSYDNFV